VNASVRWPHRWYGPCPAPSRLTGARWWLARHRRVVAAGCAALAVWCGLAVLRPPPPPTETVVTVARDLSAGITLGAADLRLVALPPAAVPGGSLRDAAQAQGHVLAGPVRAGEPVTDVRLAATRLLAPGTVATPVRPADAGVVGLLRLGDRVDVLAVPAAGGGGPVPGSQIPPGAAAPGATTRVVGAGLVVLALPGPGGASASGADNLGPASPTGLVVVAATPAVALQLAAAAAQGALSLTIQR